MNIFIAAAIGIVVGFISGALVFRKNAAKIGAVALDVKTVAGAIKPETNAPVKPN
jgi:uncharacterized membrane-anchored protein YhcB (DUF1043 family)